MKRLRIVALRGFLQQFCGNRIDLVKLTTPPPVVMSAHVKGAGDVRSIEVRFIVPDECFFRNRLQTGSTDARGSSREVLPHHVLVESNRLKNLRSAVAEQRGNAHFCKDLEHSLADRLEVVLLDLWEGQRIRKHAIPQ